MRESANGRSRPLGVGFPEVDGRRSTTATSRGIIADAARAVEPALAERIDTCPRWREQYVGFLLELTELAGDPESSLAMARAGLESMRARLVLEDGTRAVPLADAWLQAPAARTPGTREIRGAGSAPAGLEVPFGEGTLRGQSLADALERWAQADLVEPSFAEAITRVADHPEWLALPGRTVALIGAGAEIGPLEPLARWGADVLAVDLPDATMWNRVSAIASAGAGTVRVPVLDGNVPGADVLANLPELGAWLQTNLDGSEPVLGMYGYADGGSHVLLTGAFDALATELLARGRAGALAYLATPTDAYIVPERAVETARAAYRSRGFRALLQAPAKLASGGRLFRPAYASGVPVADVLVKQQGPNYAVAKRLQRWRGVHARAAGHRVSFNIAPATWTRSVTKNRVLAAAYAGARHFGIEIFPPSTTRALMAALLVHDLNHEPDRNGNPERLFSESAAHGGLWTAAYEPRSALSVAALAGLPTAALRRRPR